MRLDSLRPAKGSVKKRKRIGCGIGSGHGKTATRGTKGQKSRSGSRARPGFEGGQMPLHRRLPKRGFRPLQKVEYVVVNLESLNGFEAGTVVDKKALKEKGLIKHLHDRVKVLGKGKLKSSLKVKADAFSRSAKEKIVKRGGEVIVGD
jgi:large subunit ribosomal protein L15